MNLIMEMSDLGELSYLLGDGKLYWQVSVTFLLDEFISRTTDETNSLPNKFYSDINTVLEIMHQAKRLLVDLIHSHFHQKIRWVK